MILQMDIGGFAPRIYTLETMKHTGTLVVRGMYRRYIISYIPVTRYQVVYIYARTWCVTSSQTIIVGAPS